MKFKIGKQLSRQYFDGKLLVEGGTIELSEAQGKALKGLEAIKGEKKVKKEEVKKEVVQEEAPRKFFKKSSKKSNKK